MQRKRYFAMFTVAAVLMQMFAMQAVHAASAGDVVINEVAWAGSVDGSSDEWIELYNNTNADVDLSGWTLEDDGTAIDIVSGVIPARGYFLIEDGEESTSVGADALIGLSLANAGDSLVLKDEVGAIIDEVNSDGGAWFAGGGTDKASMERVDPAVSGDDAENWADAETSGVAFGAAGGVIFGTPGSANGNFAGSGSEVNLVVEGSGFDLGEEFVVSVIADGVVDLYSYGMEINYDENVLNFVSASEGPFLNADGEATAFNAALLNGEEGSLVVGNARLVNPPSGVDGNGELFEMTFEVVGEEGSALSVSNAFLSDSIGNVPAVFSGADIDVESGGGAVISGGAVSEATERFALEISWTEIVPADSYDVQRAYPDGAFVSLGNVSEASYVDDNGVVPGVEYTYKIVPSGGAAIEVSGAETRGLSGDGDQNDRVDGRDIEILARAYGSEIGDEEYSFAVDFNYDGVIDGSDLIDVGANFALTY